MFSSGVDVYIYISVGLNTPKGYTIYRIYSNIFVYISCVGFLDAVI